MEIASQHHVALDCCVAIKLAASFLNAEPNEMKKGDRDREKEMKS